MRLYKNLCEKNKSIADSSKKFKLNAYRSPSPMNELCDYISRWEKKNILWDNCINDLVELTDRSIIRKCRKYINDYAAALKFHYAQNTSSSDDSSDRYRFDFDLVINEFRRKLKNELHIDDYLIANYVILTSYSSVSISKSFAWAAYGVYIIENLKSNTNPKRNIRINEVPYKVNDSYEYLGKYYEFEVGDSYLHM